MTRRFELEIATLLLSCSVAAACSTDQPKAPASIDAGAAPAPAVAAIVDAGAPPAPAVVATAATANNDAGPARDAGGEVAPAAVAPTDPPSAGRAKSSVFDRLLVKPKERGADPQQIKALVEEKTGLKVELARRTAGSWVMLQLVAVPGGRDEKDQQKAVSALKALGIFEVVEADRMMKVKMP